MGTLTKRDREILNFIKDYMMDWGTTPTIREIGIGVGLYSTASVYNHFQKLVRLGYINPVSDKSFRYSVKGMKYVEEEGETWDTQKEQQNTVTKSE